MPKLTSNCASQLKAVPCGEDILITYNSEDCLEDEENFVELTFKMPGKSLKHKFYFQVKKVHHRVAQSLTEFYFNRLNSVRLCATLW